MQLDDVERLIGLFERFRLTELEYSEGAMKVRILRQDRSTPTHEATEKPLAKTSPADPSTHDPADPPAVTSVAAESPSFVIAGMPATFYRAPGPGQAPYVSEGDLVEEGQTLALLEAMKMLNPVEADRAGRILSILVRDGETVAAGTHLFAIAPRD